MAGLLTALVVIPPELRAGLIPCLRRFPSYLRIAATCQEAAQVLKDDPAVQVVLTDLYLPDGTWIDVLRRAAGAQSAPRVVVCPRVADEGLWAQVLEAGAFDVLVRPYREPEVFRILEAAAIPARAMAAG